MNGDAIMTEGQARQGLIALLFEQGGCELVNIKFCRGDNENITVEQVCREAESAIQQRCRGEARVSRSFDEGPHSVNVRHLLQAR